MRSIGLIVAGSVVAACSGPDADPAANAGMESLKVAARNESFPADKAEPEPAVAVADAGSDRHSENVSPCLMQGADRLHVPPIRAVGTEPFWGARVEGRCVTYTTPDNQRGVRIWTRYVDHGDGRGTWVGQLSGKAFEMRTRPEANCSDGMSDHRYPIAVDLTVMGENRNGCAEEL